MTWILVIIAWIASPLSILLSFLGVLIRVALLAIPVWLFWTVGGYGESLQGVVPDRFIDAGLFEIVGLLIAFSCVRAVVLPSGFGRTAVEKAADKHA